jgi:hypothetical protein
MALPLTGLHFTSNIAQTTLRLSAMPLGEDISVAICGGERGHIGAVAVSQPRPSLADPERVSSTTSVITLLGHKEDELARQVAGQLAQKLGVTVTVACGIHIDAILPQQIVLIEQGVQQLTAQLITACQAG